MRCRLCKRWQRRRAAGLGLSTAVQSQDRADMSWEGLQLAASHWTLLDTTIVLVESYKERQNDHL